MRIKKNQIVLELGDKRFSIHPIDVEGPILINDKIGSYEIFLCLNNPPNFFIDDERSHFNFHERSFNLLLKRTGALDVENSWRLQNALQFFAEVYNVVNLKQQYMKEDIPLVKEADDLNSFYKKITIKAWHSKYAAVLPPKLPTRTVARLMSCSSLTLLQLLLDVAVPTRFEHLAIPDTTSIQLPFEEYNLSSSYVKFGRVKVTPSRLIFMPLAAVKQNRIFRYFPDPQKFMLISFVDEHEGDPWRSKNIYNWFLEKLHDGIAVDNKRYTFLGCSSSQLREGHAWLSVLDRNIVYNLIGKFPETWSAGRKLSRIALPFAASDETVELNHECYLKNVAPDIETGTICFSDGIGRGSFKLFHDLQTILKLPQNVSALQIRVGGVKGVISRFNQLGDVTLRNSMKKFESDHNKLEVLNYSRSLSMTLSRHVILLLSNFGVPDEVFLDLQFNELAKCMEALSNDEQSLSFVKAHSKIFNWETFPTNQVVQEPLFRQMLTSNAIELLTNLVDRANIPVEKGRLLMGVLDETSTLNYGEIYAHIIEDGVDFEVSGTVLLYRNPCVLPSDIRVLTARASNLPANFKALYRNCVVIPSRGLDSHARECSGGDLDGDLYYVVWDQRLIPAGLIKPGLKVIEIETKEIIAPTAGNSDLDMMKFFCDYVSKNQLGVLANAHLATADQLTFLDPKSIELAKYVTVETDVPKKGLTVGPINPELLPTEYPDYMRKGDKSSYRSETVLGELFRQAMPILEILLERRIVNSPKSRLNFTRDEKKVEGMYAMYSFEIQKLMQSFELDSEVDLFSGSPIWRRGYMSAFKQQNQLRETVRVKMTEFWRKWTRIFEEWREKVENDQSMIIDWFNRPKTCYAPAFSFSFLALPYIAQEGSKRLTVIESIQESTARWIFNNKLQWGGEWRARYNVGSAIMMKLPGVECHFYGSSMLGLNEEYSDVDLYASDPNLESLTAILKSIDKNAMTMTKPHACVRLTFESLAVDVTNFVGGVKKTYALAEMFDKNPGLWPALRVLVEWARAVGIVKSGGKQGFMTVISFCHLFIYYATSTPPRFTEPKTYSLARLNIWIESMRGLACGNYIHGFLKLLSDRKQKSWVASKVDPLDGKPLIKSDLIDDLQKRAEIAIYILAIHDGDVKKLFQFCTKKRLFRIHKRYMNPDESSEGLQASNMNEIRAKCNPKKHPVEFELLTRNGLFYLEVTCDHKYFADVERGLSKIHNKIISARISGLRRLNAYHIINATIIIPEFGNGSQSEVSFGPYQQEDYHPAHTGVSKSVLKLRNFSQNQNWRSTEYERYSSRFLSQLQLFKAKQGMKHKGARVWRFFGEMGKQLVS